MTTPNADMIQYWSEISGPNWVQQQDRLDRMLDPLGQQAMAALGIERGHAVIDIGCGCGGAALDIAERVGPTGRVLGLDVSAPMVGWAQNRASDAGLADRLEIRLQDAQTADLEPVYDAAFSRFGVMFFDDPVAALSNVHGALQPGGRLAFACWQAPDLNPWIARSMEVAGRYAELPPPAEPGAPGPFSLADPDTVRGILGRAGFSGVEFTDVRAPLIVGTTAGDAAHWFSGTGAAAAAIKQGERPVETLAEFREALRSVFEPWFEEGHGVAAPSAAWIVSAQA